jgi:hypothetical protein
MEKHDRKYRNGPKSIDVSAIFHGERSSEKRPA